MKSGIDRFANRRAAGLALAPEVKALKLRQPVVLALPRGGVPVAVEIAALLHAPVDLVFVRKIGVPSQPELALAAVVNGDRPETIVNEDVLRATRLDPSYVDEQAKTQLKEIARRRKIYLAGRQQRDLRGRDVVIVDDGVATGASLRAAIAAVRRQQPSRIVVALPVAPEDAVKLFRSMVDDIVCLATPDPFVAISMYYDEFHQLEDEEVVSLLDEADRRTGAVPPD